jgi:predicted DCC family thiol-disulfide oxidoreductase YuxK
MEQSAVLFFDGECAFCTFWVRTVLRWERTPDLKFCSSASKSATILLSTEQRQKLTKTILLQFQGNWSEKSTAALLVLQRFRWFGFLGYLGFYVPLPFRDAIYDFIAKHRHRLLRGRCELPRDPSRFL